MTSAATENIISLPFDTNVDLNKGLSQYFLEACQKHKNEIAQIDSTTGKKETYGEFLGRSIHLAQALRNKGITSKDVVAYCCNNNMDYAVTITATMLIGAQINPLDISASKSEILYCLSLSKPKIIFCDNEIEDVLHAAIMEQNLDFEIVVYNVSTKFITYSDFLEKYKSDQKKFEIDTSKTGMDTACICYTSGTSGKSKAAQLKHFSMYYSSFVGIRSFPGTKTIMIFTLPYWISNICWFVTALIHGLTRVIFKNFSKETLCKVLEKYKVNMTLLNQFMINELIQNPEFCKIDTSNLLYISYGGSTIGVNQISAMKNLFPSSTMLNGYGLTEISTVFFPSKKEYNYSKNKNIRFTVGKPIPGFTYKVVDPTTEEKLGPNKQGELRIKHIGLWNGYIDNPKATEEAIDSEGFFKTGDIAYYDEDHYFFIIDRLKEIFKYKGFHISPIIIEDELLAHPDVKDAVAIGKPDDKYGELPMGAILLKSNSKVTEEDLIKYISDRLPDIYHLRGGIKFVSEIPKTSTGKKRRKFMRDQIVNEKL